MEDFSRMVESVLRHAVSRGPGGQGVNAPAESSPRIPLANPDIGPLEEDHVLAALRSGRLSMGPWGEELERLLADFTSLPWAAAVSSGTAGLHLAVRALGIGPEDCVVTSSFSFVASANAIRYEGAEPIFVDIDPDTLCMSPDALAKYLDSCREEGDILRDPASGRRVAGVLSVDAFGHPADLAAISSLARPRGLVLVSDSCEALGSRTAEGHHVGTQADVSVLAFYPNKQITTGEGGAVLGTDTQLRDLIVSLRNQGRRPGDAWLYHEVVGYNYRMDELSAALGVAQMRRVEDILARRSQVAVWYAEALAELEELALPHAARGVEPAWFVYALRVQTNELRDELVAHLNEHGVECKAYFDPPIHLQPPYRDGRSCLPVTEDAAKRTLVLPYFATMTQEQVRRVAEVVKDGLARARR
jgi:perosamine synthetase